jgi:hypothetical protein
MSPERITSQLGALVLMLKAMMEVITGSVSIPSSGRPKYKKNNCTRKGVFLKNSTHPVAIPRSKGYRDRLIKATIRPRKKPRINELTEISTVSFTPWNKSEVYLNKKLKLRYMTLLSSIK